jgi:hypothetical protein
MVIRKATASKDPLGLNFSCDINYVPFAVSRFWTPVTLELVARLDTIARGNRVALLILVFLDTVNTNSFAY